MPPWRHILTSRTEHRDVQSQGRSTYLFLLRITAHLGFTNPWQAARREAVRVASCLPAQKPSGWLASVDWQFGSPCRWLPVGSRTRSPVGTAHRPDTKYLHMHAVESMRGVMRLGHRCESRAAKYNDPGSSICGISCAGERLKGTAAAQPAT
jgi:hypothetical protein